MSTISALSGQPPKFSMQERLQKELQSEVSSGAISSSDESALSEALDTIDDALRPDAASATTTPSSPKEMKAKIQSLISDQVEAGTLTEDQAAELSSLFENAGPEDGAGAPPPPDGAGGTAGSQALDDFLSALQSQSTSGYGAGGSTGGTRASALVLDTTA